MNTTLCMECGREFEHAMLQFQHGPFMSHCPQSVCDLCSFVMYDRTMRCAPLPVKPRPYRFTKDGKVPDGYLALIRKVRVPED